MVNTIIDHFRYYALEASYKDGGTFSYHLQIHSRHLFIAIYTIFIPQENRTSLFLNQKLNKIYSEKNHLKITF
ncbi:hypothetical protein [Seonamhaeicola sp. S2-3]|uniref:hypothetical protein n=1 Tax=Seonamhaeicola sp. S2-3 TaxID=1936081 RepID=UPI0012F7715E|nr:hypothetical protein [Seonamhaeicola sp. S2-3]